MRQGKRQKGSHGGLPKRFLEALDEPGRLGALRYLHTHPTTKALQEECTWNRAEGVWVHADFPSLALVPTAGHVVGRLVELSKAKKKKDRKKKRRSYVEWVNGLLANKGRDCPFGISTVTGRRARNDVSVQSASHYGSM